MSRNEGSSVTVDTDGGQPLINVHIIEKSSSDPIRLKRIYKRVSADKKKIAPN